MIVKTWCENTEEGMGYLKFNGYNPICRISESLWLVRSIGKALDDVKVVRLFQKKRNRSNV